MKLEIGYKVVESFNGELCSAVIRDSKFRVVYKVGEITNPIVRGTKLMAFMEYANALEFQSSNGGLIYRAILIDPEPLKFVASVGNGTFTAPYEVIKYWDYLLKSNYNGLGQVYKNQSWRYAPQGSFACAGIQLIEEANAF